MISSTEQIALVLMTFIIMIGMGATLRLADFKTAMTQPKALLVGMLCQFGLMPAIAFMLGQLFALPALFALSLLFIGATPGGTTSNLFTYLARGNVALSVTMTVCSTIMAVALMPLMIRVWAADIDLSGLQIPYTNIVAVLVILITAVSIGMFLRSRGERIGHITERIGAGIGIAFIAFLLVSWFGRNYGILGEYPASYFIAPACLTVFGFLFGWIVARAFGLSATAARTVFLETGIQNTPLTIAVIVLSFPSNVVQDMLVIPAFYAVLVVLLSVLVTMGVRVLSAPSAK